MSRGPVKATPRPIRGDVNAILNRMIAEGVIRSFETNFDSPASAGLALHVMVRTERVIAEEDRRALRARITEALAHLYTDVVVSVRPSRGGQR